MRARRLVVALAILIGVAACTAVGAYAAFTALFANSGNSFESGTVAVEDNDSGNAMLALPSAKPGDSDTSCIKVKYTGSLPSTVRLYATRTGTLDPYLTLTVTRGTDASPAFDSCTTFQPDPVDYGNGNGVVYTGTLAAFPADYTNGIVDPTAAAPESWTTNEEHLYRFVITLANNTAAQGKSGTAAFTWEARNQ